MFKSLLASTLALLGATAPAFAAVDSVTVGVMKDLSGIYAGEEGNSGLTAAELAVEDFKAKFPNAGFEVKVLLGDHQNKPDIGSAVARKWFEVEGVDMIVDLPHSGVALAVSQVASDLNKAVLISGAGSTAITTTACNNNTVHWTYDTFATAQGAINASAGEGRDKWFFITADYSFGHNLEENASAALEALGYTTVGSAKAPFGTSDFSSYLLQAQSSGANMVGFANAGGDFTNAAKQAVEFGLPQQGVGLGALWAGVLQLHTIGLANAQGLSFVVPFYWNANDRTRSLTDRFQVKHPGLVMSEEDSGVYGATLAYLEAVVKADSVEGDAVISAIKTLKIDDIFGEGYVRADGRKVHDMKLYTAKAVDASTSEWDLFKLVKTIPADKAFAPMIDACNFK